MPGRRWPCWSLHALIFRFVIDDAFISFRYAQNLNDGHGLVFNPGERVEGYSNLLWVLLTAFGMKLGLTRLLWARILGTGAMAGVLALAPGIVRILAARATEFSAAPGRVAQLSAGRCRSGGLLDAGRPGNTPVHPVGGSGLAAGPRRATPSASASSACCSF